MRLLLSAVLMIGWFYLLFSPIGFWSVLAEGLAICVLFIVWIGFAVSLKPARTPMISRYAILLEPNLTTEEFEYTRKVTWLWVGLLTVLLLLRLLTSISALELPLLTGVGFILMAAVFIGEFYWRRQRFQQREHGGFIEFLYEVSALPLKSIWLFDKYHKHKIK